MIEITNNSPSNSTSNKDRVSIWALTWVSNNSSNPVAAKAIKYDGEEIAENATATAAPGDVLTFTSEDALSMTIAVNGGEATPSTTPGSISWTAPETDGEYTLTITAKGDEGTDEQTATIKVTVETPVLAAEPIKFEDTEIAENATANAKPGDVLTFTSVNAKSMSITVGEDTQNATGNEITWTAPEIDGEYTLNISAQGDEGTEAQSAILKVTVATPVPTGDVTFDFVNETYGMTRLSGTTSEYNPDNIPVKNENVTIVLGGGEKATRLWKDGVRFYTGSHMTISVPAIYVITEITMSDGSNFALADGVTGTFANGIWRGEAQSVKINSTLTGDKQAVASIDVSYAPASPAIHIDGNILENDGIDLEGATKNIHFVVAEGVTVWHKFVEATSTTPSEVISREAAAEDNDGFTQYTGTADNGLELTKVGTLHYYTEYKGLKSAVKTLTVHNTPTSIREITAEGAAAGAIYDLQGRKVVAPAKGIFIVNGKKVRM